MARSRSAGGRVKGSGRGKRGRATGMSRTRKTRGGAPPTPSGRRLMSRVPTVGAVRGRVASTARAAPTAADSGVPEAMVNRTNDPVIVEIAFGQAQHGSYTIQLFDPSGT